MVTATDGKPKPATAVGGRGMSATASSPVVSSRPTAIAAAQWIAAIQRLRHSSQAIAANAGTPSTGALPIAAIAAIRRSASGLRSANMKAWTSWSSSEGPPRSSRDALNHAHSHATANRQTASSSSEADSGRRGSITAAV